jgi:hypothetical protein
VKLIKKFLKAMLKISEIFQKFNIDSLLQRKGDVDVADFEEDLSPSKKKKKSSKKADPAK